MKLLSSLYYTWGISALSTLDASHIFYIWDVTGISHMRILSPFLYVHTSDISRHKTHLLLKLLFYSHVLRLFNYYTSPSHTSASIKLTKGLAGTEPNSFEMQCSRTRLQDNYPGSHSLEEVLLAKFEWMKLISVLRHLKTVIHLKFRAKYENGKKWEQN